MEEGQHVGTKIRGGVVKPKGVVVKKVPRNYEISNEEAELIAKLTEKGYIILLDRKDNVKRKA